MSPYPPVRFPRTFRYAGFSGASKNAAAAAYPPVRLFSGPFAAFSTGHAREVDALARLGLTLVALDELADRRKALRVAAAAARSDDDQALIFASRAFVACCLPVRPTTARTYTRVNGDTRIHLTAGEHGLPFGADRLVLFWLASAFFACGQPADNTIRFSSARDILRAFGIDGHGGRIYQELRARVLRLFEFQIQWRSRDDRGRTIDRQRHGVIESVRMDFLVPAVDGHAQDRHAWSQRIRLDPTWAADLRAGRVIPYDLDTVAALRDSPGTLDLYQWQAWRSWYLLMQLRRPTSVPIFGPNGLLAQFGSAVKSPRKARQQLARQQATIAQLWPSCPNWIQGDRFCLAPGQAVTVAHSLVRLPGVSRAPTWVLEREARKRKRLDAIADGNWLDLERSEPQA